MKLKYMCKTSIYYERQKNGYRARQSKTKLKTYVSHAASDIVCIGVGLVEI